MRLWRPTVWTSLTARTKKAEVMDAEFKPIEKQTDNESVDEELNRFIGMFKLVRESGYTLKIIPGTPEENAPTFQWERGENLQGREVQREGAGAAASAL